MKKTRAIFFFLLSILALPVYAEQGLHAADHQADPNCRTHNRECDLQNRGQCGKRRGDCYGKRSPVHTVDEARFRLQDYFAERKLTLSEITEKPWRFEAELRDASGKVVDRVLIDKRSGRVRSMF